MHLRLGTIILTLLLLSSCKSSISNAFDEFGCMGSYSRQTSNGARSHLVITRNESTYLVALKQDDNMGEGDGTFPAIFSDGLLKTNSMVGDASCNKANGIVYFEGKTFSRD